MKYLLSMLLLCALAAASYSQQPNFGATADIGDREVLIGQPTNTDAPGAILVFQRSLSGAGWDLNATLTASDGATGDGFRIRDFRGGHADGRWCTRFRGRHGGRVCVRPFPDFGGMDGIRPADSI